MISKESYGQSLKEAGTTGIEETSSLQFAPSFSYLLFPSLHSPFFSSFSFPPLLPCPLVLSYLLCSPGFLSRHTASFQRKLGTMGTDTGSICSPILSSPFPSLSFPCPPFLLFFALHSSSSGPLFSLPLPNPLLIPLPFSFSPHPHFQISSLLTINNSLLHHKTLFIEGSLSLPVLQLHLNNHSEA